MLEMIPPHIVSGYSVLNLPVGYIKVAHFIRRIVTGTTRKIWAKEKAAIAENPISPDKM